MPNDHSLERQVQDVLNEMSGNKEIPFALNVGKITKAESDYTIHFYDSRLRTARLRLIKGQRLTEAVRATVLDRVEKMSGPLSIPS